MSTTLYGIWDAEHNAWADPRAPLLTLTDELEPSALYPRRLDAERAARYAADRFRELDLCYLRGTPAVSRHKPGPVAEGALRINPPRLAAREVTLTPGAL